MEFLELAKKRYSCRKFSDEKVSDALVEKILQAGIVAPTAVNYQPFHLYVMDSEKAVEVVNQSTRFGFGCKTFIIVGVSRDEGYVRKYDGHAFAEVDASIVATHIMLEIEDLGLHTTWVGHFDQEVIRKAYPDVFGDDLLIAIFPIGYASVDGVPSSRHFERKSMEELVRKL